MSETIFSFKISHFSCIKFDSTISTIYCYFHWIYFIYPTTGQKGIHGKGADIHVVDSELREIIKRIKIKSLKNRFILKNMPKYSSILGTLAQIKFPK